MTASLTKSLNHSQCFLSCVSFPDKTFGVDCLTDPLGVDSMKTVLAQNPTLRPSHFTVLTFPSVLHLLHFLHHFHTLSLSQCPLNIAPPCRWITPSLWSVRYSTIGRINDQALEYLKEDRNINVNHVVTIIIIVSSVRSSNSHPDQLLVSTSTHFFRSHWSSTLDFHFLSHNSYIKSNLWTHLLAIRIPYGYNRTSLQDSAR